MVNDAKLYRQFELLSDMLLRNYGSRTLYEALGVKPDCSHDDIQLKFREKAFKYHPDRNKSPDAEAKFKVVNNVYGILSDPEKRRGYDAWRTAQLSQAHGQPQPSYAQPRQPPYAQPRQPMNSAQRVSPIELEKRVQGYLEGKIPISELTKGVRVDQYEQIKEFINDYYIRKMEAAERESRKREEILEAKHKTTIEDILRRFKLR